jgi:hypothetical protein
VQDNNRWSAGQKNALSIMSAGATMFCTRSVW